jgi:Mce-associated membrane protein
VTVDVNKSGPGDEPTHEESSEAVEIAESDEVTEDSGEVTEDSDEVAEGSGEKDAEPVRYVANRRLAGARRYVGVILVAAALVASAGLAGWLYFFQYRPDQQTNTAAANIALEAAKSGTVALLSYSPDSLDKDFAAAKSNLTGDFLSYYTQFTEQIVTPAAKEKSVKTTASVVRAAVSEIHPDAATVLVFINQTTTSKENPDGAFAASSVKVSLKKIDDRWLISAFEPV